MTDRLTKLANPGELITTREATLCAVTRELPVILRNLKVQYRIHKRFLLVPILSQINKLLATIIYIRIYSLGLPNPESTEQKKKKKNYFVTLISCAAVILTPV
jgi:hypothetical protein